MDRIVLVADDPAVLDAVRLALRLAPGLRMVSALDGRASTAGRLAELEPTVVIVDQMCQRTNALLRIQEAVDAVPGAMVIYLGKGISGAPAEEAFAAGADAAVSRDVAPATLGVLIGELAQGNVAMAHRPTGPRVRAAGGSAAPALRALRDQEPPVARTSA